MKYFVGIEVEADTEEQAKSTAFDKFYFGEWGTLIAQSTLPDVIGDPIADHWVLEICNQTNLTIESILSKIYHIQRTGRGSLTSTNSYRVPLSYIAEDYGVKLTDGSEINQSSTPKAKTEQ